MERRYPLRTSLGVFVLVLVVFGGAGIALAWLAAHDSAGLLVYNLLRFTAGEARVVYGVLAAFSFGLCAAGIVSVIRTRTGGMTIVIDDKTITLPRLFSRRPRVLRFDQVTAVHLVRHRSMEMLRLTTSYDGIGTVNPAHLDQASYAEIVSTVLARVRPEATGQVAKAPRRERPLVKPPLPGPASVDGAPFRGAPSAHVGLVAVATAPAPAPAPRADQLGAEEPKLLA